MVVDFRELEVAFKSVVASFVEPNKGLIVSIILIVSDARARSPCATRQTFCRPRRGRNELTMAAG
ncbi:MAG: hypothetical protein PHW08_02645 [Kiritimatiellae bacterium]|nr:hypothetical protein [Kiritimatiellia bacterium]